MSETKRIQRKRAKGWRMPEGAVYVGRPSRWGNPFGVVSAPSMVEGGIRYPAVHRLAELNHPSRTSVNESKSWIVSREKGDILGAAFRMFELHTGPMGSYEWDDAEGMLAPLRGRDLACWCPLDQSCHADVLLELARESAPVAAPAGGEDAIRHPKRGQAHRPVFGAPVGVTTNVRGEVTACGAPIRHLTERVPLARSAPEDRCKRCWPISTSGGEAQ